MDVNVVKRCRLCQKVNSMKVPSDKYIEYLGGSHVQNVFPNLNPTEREFLITGCCPSCQEKMFGEVEATDKIESVNEEDEFDGKRN